jgi:hypothetical protein
MRIGIPALALTITRSALLAALTFAGAAYAQQPVRDVNDPTRQPASGSCTITWWAMGSNSCRIYTVPVGKKLAVRDVTFRCYISNMAELAYGGIGNGFVAEALVPLQSVPSGNSAQKAKIGARNVFYHQGADGSGGMLAFAYLHHDAQTSPSCQAVFHGYLVDAN